MTEDEAFEFLAYLIACADISRREPALYGPYRLLDGASRLAAIVKERADGRAREFWSRMHEEIEQKVNWHVYDMPGWNEFVSSLPVTVAEEFKRRGTPPGA
jgi:hypothetical protein